MDLRKVLIADPTEEFRAALTQALSSGFQVVTCARGDEAAALLDSEQPDLLILELSLPGLDGISLLEQLEARPPVLVVTELLTPYIHQALIRLRVEYAIRKPSPIQAVADRAYDLVRTADAAREPGCLQEALIRLGLSSGRQGFAHLLTGIPLLSRNRNQLLSKELYETIAALDHSTPAAVEKAIRESLRRGWESGDRREWSRLFPGRSQCPRNKEFLFRMADLLREHRRCG